MLRLPLLLELLAVAARCLCVPAGVRWAAVEASGLRKNSVIEVPGVASHGVLPGCICLMAGRALETLTAAVTAVAAMCPTVLGVGIGTYLIGPVCVIDLSIARIASYAYPWAVVHFSAKVVAATEVVAAAAKVAGIVVPLVLLLILHAPVVVAVVAVVVEVVVGGMYLLLHPVHLLEHRLILHLQLLLVVLHLHVLLVVVALRVVEDLLDRIAGVDLCG